MVLVRTKCDHFVEKGNRARFTRQALGVGCFQHKEGLMKKLLVLMIVLFPVTAGGGSACSKD